MSEQLIDNQYKSTLINSKEFDGHLDSYLEKLLLVKTNDKLRQFISNSFTELCNLYINIADEIQSKQIESDSNYNFIESYLFNYSFPENIKNTLILHRDVLLQLCKSEIYLSENVITKTQFSSHFSESKHVLEEQLRDLKNDFQLNYKNLVGNKKEQKKVLKKLNLQSNPWDVYKSQINTLLLQFDDINISQANLSSAVVVCNELNKVVKSLFDNFKELTQKLQVSASHISTVLKEEIKHKELMFFIDEQLVKIVALGNNQTTFTDDINANISKLKKIKAPITVQHGLLAIRELDFNKSMQKWFDYQVLPDFMDVIAIENSLKNINGICLNNLKNSIQIAKNNQTSDNLNAFKQTVDNLENDIKDFEIKGNQIIEIIINKCKDQLLVSHFLSGKPFLEVPFNSSLNLTRDTFFLSIKQSIQKGMAFFNYQLKNSTTFNAESNLELATTCLTSRMFKDSNEHYDSLFLNKKFIGDLFLIAREQQEETLKTTISQWNNGFNKSVLVTGERLSGRTTFIDYTSKKYFGKDVVKLQPNSIATIDGRKFNKTYNVKDAHQFIKNNNIKSTRPVIIIDDLELWRDHETSLLNNVRVLINFIETESDDAFLIVAVTNEILHHLDNRLAFSNAFSSVLDVSKTDKNKIKEALLLRHGAAHRKLVSIDDEPLTSKQIEKAIHKLSHKYQNNLGDVLQAWTYHTFVKEDDTILFKNEDYDFPNFFTQQELIILKQASIFKTISELGLKRVLALSFDEDFKSATKRLINTKVLLRDKKGSLYINPVVLNEVNVFINQRN
mgnify:CR=1 FL=1